MRVDEQQARRLVLAEAIETADTHGELVSHAEREQLDRQVLDAARATPLADDADEALTVSELLRLRAARLLNIVRARNPAIAALQDVRPWERGLAIGIPAATFIFGVASDRIANPYRVDLLSLPLLVVVFWNLAMYALLLTGFMLSRSGPQRQPFAAVRRWAAGWQGWRGRPAHLRAEVTALFQLRWQPVAAALNGQRWRRVLHLAAAAWGAGVAVSLLTRGLVVEYRVGWESTFLDATQVHAIFRLLFWPVTTLFPFAPFSIQEVAGLRFDAAGAGLGANAGPGAGFGALAGARWVMLYAGLLLLVVVVPRVLLALTAWLRARTLSQVLAIDFCEHYYERLIARLRPTRAQLSLVTHRAEDQRAMLRVLDPDSGAADSTAATQASTVATQAAVRPALFSTVIHSAHGDQFRLALLPVAPGLGWVPQPPQARLAGLAGRALNVLWRPAPRPDALAAVQAPPELRDSCDAVLHVVGDPGDAAAAAPLLAWLGKPVLTVVTGTATMTNTNTNTNTMLRPSSPSVQPPGEPAVEVLAFAAFGLCWVQQPVLLAALARLLPASKAPGWTRLADAWDSRNQARFQRAMSALAFHLFDAAGLREEVRSPALSLRNVLYAERDSHQRAKRAAMDAVMEKLARSEAQATAQLARLQGVLEVSCGAPAQPPQQGFKVQEAINTPHAGVAGAASGAAMGASVDLMAGGLTLGAATALGALVGGGAALVASAWKNKAAANGMTVIQLDDDMLHRMTQAALLRYLAITHAANAEHAGPDGADAQEHGDPSAWRAEVAAALESQRVPLQPLWAAARIDAADVASKAALASVLETAMRKVLRRLYPVPHEHLAKRSIE